MNEQKNGFDYNRAYEVYKKLPVIWAVITGTLCVLLGIVIAVLLDNVGWFFACAVGGGILALIAYALMMLIISPLVVLIDTTHEIRDALTNNSHVADDIDVQDLPKL